eukprot:14647035-Ditylum_brightwellii.AAC.1
MAAVLRGMEVPYRKKGREEVREEIPVVEDREVRRLRRERMQYPIWLSRSTKSVFVLWLVAIHLLLSGHGGKRKSQ